MAAAYLTLDEVYEVGGLAGGKTPHVVALVCSLADKFVCGHQVLHLSVLHSSFPEAGWDGGLSSARVRRSHRFLGWRCAMMGGADITLFIHSGQLQQMLVLAGDVPQVRQGGVVGHY